MYREDGRSQDFAVHDRDQRDGQDSRDRRYYGGRAPVNDHEIAMNPINPMNPSNPMSSMRDRKKVDQKRFDRHQALRDRYEEKEMSPEPATPQPVHDVDQVHIEDFQIDVHDPEDIDDMQAMEGMEDVNDIEDMGDIEGDDDGPPLDAEHEEQRVEEVPTAKGTQKVDYATMESLNEVMANLERIKSQFAGLSNDVKEQQSDIAKARERVECLEKGKVFGGHRVADDGAGGEEKQERSDRNQMNDMRDHQRETKASQRGSRRKRKFVDAIEEEVEQEHAQKRRRFGS